MAEAIIGGIGLLSLIGTVETGLKLYVALVESTQAAGKDCRLLAIKIFLEEERFDLYAQYVGIRRVGERPLVQQLPLKTQELVCIIVGEITTLLQDSETLLKKYGMSTIESDASTSASLPPVSPTIQRAKTMPVQNSIDFPKPKLKYKQRVRWIWKDSKKVFELYQHLRDLNDNLWATLAPLHWSRLQKALPSFLFPGFNDIAALAEIKENMKEDKSLKLVVDCAEMRQLTMLPLRDMERSEAWSQLMIPKSQIKLTKDWRKEGVQRSEGVLRTGKTPVQVVIEYKVVLPYLTAEQKLVARNRIRQMAFQLLQPPNPDVCLFQCAGLIEESLDPLRYGVVLKIADSPGPEVISLKQLLADKKTWNFVDLADRFALAQSLSYAILQWHASGWLHKGISTDNIVFVKSNLDFPDISSPKLLGFASSRPDDVAEESLISLPQDEKIDWYRHPDYQIRANVPFRRSYDYFSLGVVLLAIGWWETVENLGKRFTERQPSNANDPSKWADFLVNRAETSLGSSCGRIYRTAVLRCLRGDFGVDESGNEIDQDSSHADWQKAFLFTVVHELARCEA